MDFSTITIGGYNIGLIISGILTVIGAITTIGVTIAHITATDKDDAFFAKVTQLLGKVNNFVTSADASKVAVVTTKASEDVTK